MDDLHARMYIHVCVLAYIHIHSLQTCLHTPTDQLRLKVIHIHACALYTIENYSTDPLTPQSDDLTLKCWWWECFQTNCQVRYLLRESTPMMCVDKTWNRPDQWVSAIQSGQSMEMAAEVAHTYTAGWWESKVVKSQPKYWLTEISKTHQLTHSH